MGLNQTDQIEKGILARQKKSEKWILKKRTEQSTGIAQTEPGFDQIEETKMQVLPRTNGPKQIQEFGYQTEQTDRNMGIAQTKHTEAWVLSRPNKPKYGY